MPAASVTMVHGHGHRDHSLNSYSHSHCAPCIFSRPGALSSNWQADMAKLFYHDNSRLANHWSRSRRPPAWERVIKVVLCSQLCLRSRCHWDRHCILGCAWMPVRVPLHVAWRRHTLTSYRRTPMLWLCRLANLHPARGRGGTLCGAECAHLPLCPGPWPGGPSTRGEEWLGLACWPPGQIGRLVAPVSFIARFTPARGAGSHTLSAKRQAGQDESLNIQDFKMLCVETYLTLTVYDESAYMMQLQIGIYSFSWLISFAGNEIKVIKLKQYFLVSSSGAGSWLPKKIAWPVCQEHAVVGDLEYWRHILELARMKGQCLLYRQGKVLMNSNGPKLGHQP